MAMLNESKNDSVKSSSFFQQRGDGGFFQGDKLEEEQQLEAMKSNKKSFFGINIKNSDLYEDVMSKLMNVLIFLFSLKTLEIKMRKRLN